VLQSIYHVIVIFLAGLVAAVMWREKSLGRQICGCIVLVVLILRIFLVK